jgi:hypothetical protein
MNHPANIATSPDRHTFSEKGYKEKLIMNPDNEIASSMLSLIESRKQNEIDKINDPKWQKDNLEYDLRSTKWICDKAKASEGYAQNLYAAMCNTDFVKNDVWPLLQDKRWSCSWRYAGGIVSHIVETGDYIDWYCSGIKGDVTDEEFSNMSKKDQEQYLYTKTHFVSEGVVTEEIREDLLKLGWLVIQDDTE